MPGPARPLEQVRYLTDQSMIPASQLSQLPPDEQTKVIGLLFEPCPTLVEYIWPVTQQKAESWPQYIESVRSRLMELLEHPSDDRIPAIIAAHPRLGAKKVDSALSQKEQESLKAASEEEGRLLADLNDEYERTFPGLRYVVFVAGRSRPVIMEDMRRRIAQNDIESEKRTAFNAMCDIALDRSKTSSSL